MKYQELEELYKDRTYNPTPNLHEEMTDEERAEALLDMLSPKELLEMAESVAKSLHYTPSKQMKVVEAIQEYFYKKLTNQL